ncbi:MAG: SurA N-terminal domain-containing protein [Flavobacteriales bacterium]|nr:SurA N-terminal domain-containing protein [Flavobacteriales bacterium]
MAVLGSIRKYSWLVMVVIGLGLLLFIGGDFFSNQSGSSRNSDLAEINDVVVSPQEYDNRLQQQINSFKQRSGQSTLDDRTMDLIKDQVWGQLKSEIILKGEYYKLGIDLGEDELENMTTGPNPHKQIVQSFRDPNTGQFNSGLVLQYLQNMDNDASGQQRAQWVTLENEIVGERILSKYTSMVKQGLYVTNDEIQKNLASNGKIASIQYVMKEYRSVSDDAVELSDADVKEYYNEHLSDYEQSASRSVKCVVFPVDPSEDDKLEVMSWANQIKTDFADITDDSLYINLNADTKYFGLYSTSGELPLSIDSIMFASEVGYVSDVFVEGRLYGVAKLLEKKFAPDSAKARNIFIGFNDENIAQGARSKADAKQIVDSLYTLITTVGVDLSELATTNSDAGNAQSGGQIDWFEEGAILKAISNWCFDTSIDTGIVTLLETSTGYHIVELLDRTKSVNKVRVGIIDRALDPSNTTFQDIFASSSEFAGKNNSSESFNAALGSVDVAPFVRSIEGIEKGDRNLDGYEGTREIVRWINDAREGNVSTAIEIGESYFIVLLEDVFEKGTTPLEKIRIEVESAARKEKKADMLAQEMQGALGSGAIEEASQKLSLTPQSISGVSFASDNVGQIGREPALVGTIFGMQEGETSKPIKGEQGVYIVKLETLQTLNVGDQNTARSILKSGVKSKTDYLLFDAIMDNAVVTDNRADFY